MKKFAEEDTASVIEPTELAMKSYGHGCGSQVICLTQEQLSALQNDQMLAVDIQLEYVLFLELDTKDSTVVSDAIQVCQSYARFLDGSQNALCGVAKLARSVAERTKQTTHKDRTDAEETRCEEESRRPETRRK